MSSTSDRDTMAAPPDDGGEMGNFTRPSDVMQVRAEEDRDQHGPPLHVDPTRTGSIDRAGPRANWGPVPMTLALGAAVALVVAAVVLLAGG